MGAFKLLARDARHERQRVRLLLPQMNRAGIRMRHVGERFHDLLQPIFQREIDMREPPNMIQNMQLDFRIVHIHRKLRTSRHLGKMGEMCSPLVLERGRGEVRTL